MPSLGIRLRRRVLRRYRQVPRTEADGTFSYSPVLLHAGSQTAMVLDNGSGFTAAGIASSSCCVESCGFDKPKLMTINLSDPCSCSLLCVAGVCGCCGPLRPRYKRLVDNIFPEDPKVRVAVNCLKCGGSLTVIHIIIRLNLLTIFI